MLLAGMCARRRTYLSLLRQRKVGQRKTTLLSVSLRFTTGNLRCSARPEGHLRYGPSLRSAPNGAGASRRAAPGRAQRWPVWLSGFGFPSGCAEERSGQRIRARDCLSEASSSETPLDASTAGCPQRSEGTQPAGSLFLGLLSFGEAKESESPAGARPGPRTRQRHTTSYKNNSY